jgi:hypothetical protein
LTGATTVVNNVKHKNSFWSANILDLGHILTDVFDVGHISAISVIS